MSYQRLLFALYVLSCVDCRCQSRFSKADLAIDLGDYGIHPSMIPIKRQPGPPRKESESEENKAKIKARKFVEDLRRGKINRREITALADIRGYRLYRMRYFKRAHQWFEAAIENDPSFELSLYNGARTAALTGRLKRARQLLSMLKILDTPLSKMRLELAKTDEDLSALKSKFFE